MIVLNLVRSATCTIPLPWEWAYFNLRITITYQRRVHVHCAPDAELLPAILLIRPDAPYGSVSWVGLQNSTGLRDLPTSQIWATAVQFKYLRRKADPYLCSRRDSWPDESRFLQFQIITFFLPCPLRTRCVLPKQPASCNWSFTVHRLETRVLRLMQGLGDLLLPLDFHSSFYEFVPDSMRHVFYGFLIVSCANFRTFSSSPKHFCFG